MDAKTAVQYLKKMVFPYLSHEQKMLTGKFFYEAEMMEKEQIIDSFGVGCQVESTRLIGYQDMAEQYYNETYGKSNS
jgi:hypothetical protein